MLSPQHGAGGLLPHSPELANLCMCQSDRWKNDIIVAFIGISLVYCQSKTCLHVIAAFGSFFLGD